MYNFSFRVPHRKKSGENISEDQGGMQRCSILMEPDILRIHTFQRYQQMFLNYSSMPLLINYQRIPTHALASTNKYRTLMREIFCRTKLLLYDWTEWALMNFYRVFGPPESAILFINWFIEGNMSLIWYDRMQEECFIICKLQKCAHAVGDHWT